MNKTAKNNFYLVRAQQRNPASVQTTTDTSNSIPVAQGQRTQNQFSDDERHEKYQTRQGPVAGGQTVNHKPAIARPIFISDRTKFATMHVDYQIKSNQIKAFISGSEAHKTHTEHTHTHNNGLQTNNLQISS